jgi:hypothetical protein
MSRRVRDFFGIRTEGALRWWQRPGARESQAQLSLAGNLLLLAVALPAGVTYVIASKESAAHDILLPYEHSVRVDEEATVLSVLNDRRRERGLRPLARLCVSSDLLPPYASSESAMTDQLWERVLAAHAKYREDDETLHRSASGAFTAADRNEAVAQLGELAPNAAIDACRCERSP